MSLRDFMDDKDMSDLLVSVPAEGLLHGALWTEDEGRGWTRPWRFTKGQLKALGSCRAWHPGLYRAMAACTAGVSLEFVTDSASVVVEARVDPFPKGSLAVFSELAGCPSAPPEPYDGFSCDVDGRHLACVMPDEGDSDHVRVEFLLDDPDGDSDLGLQRLPGMGEMRRVRIWLPCLTGCSLRRVVGDGNEIRPVDARRHLLVLGDSIAQGFVTGDPARTWPARLADELGLDLLNQGVGGMVFLPGSTVGLSDLADPAQVVIELGENYRYEPCQAMRVSRDIKTSLYEVGEAFPETPVWVVTPFWHSDDRWPTDPRSCFAEVPGMIRDSAGSHPQMRVVEGDRLLDADPTLMADGYEHPNASGSAEIAENLAYVMGSLGEDEEARRRRLVSLLSDGPREAFPLLECARRGKGEVHVADEGLCLLSIPGHETLVWGGDRAAAKRALDVFASRELVCVLGEKLVRDARAELGLRREQTCHMAIYEGTTPLEVDPRLDIRVLGPAYAELVTANYSHPEYLREGEVEDLLDRGLILGGFDQGRLCAFIGEHAVGAIGMLEVFPEHRRRGWALALEAAKINHQLEQGMVPWAEVWPENAESLALQKRLGLTVYPDDMMHFLSRR